MRLLAILATTSLTATSLSAAPGTKPAPTRADDATYWMSLDTSSGLTNGASQGSMKQLQLQLGSRRVASAPSAEHRPPAALGVGASLPLVTPRQDVGTRASTVGPVSAPSDIKGRMLLYWGCGEQARQGQPLEIDFASMATGKSSALTAMLTVRSMTPPASGRHSTYAEWPNADGRPVGPSASLVGDHVVQGNYTPDIRFSLTPANDFLSAMAPTSTPLPSEAVKLSWAPVAHTKGYAATVMGSQRDGTIILWVSSEVKMFGMALPDYLATVEATRLVQQKALMSPATTECAVPAEVVKATGEAAMLQMTAFGGDTDFRSPKGQPGWSVKLRSRSAYMGMLAGNPDIRSHTGTSAIQIGHGQQQQPSRKRRILKGLGSLLGGPL